MMIYDIYMHLDSFNKITSNGSEYLVTTFNINTRKIMYYMCVESSFMFNFYILKQSSNYNLTIS